jgi:hypothetical protein
VTTTRQSLLFGASVLIEKMVGNIEEKCLHFIVLAAALMPMEKNNDASKRCCIFAAQLCFLAQAKVVIAQHIVFKQLLRWP